jgi:hypothetical protein
VRLYSAVVTNFSNMNYSSSGGLSRLDGSLALVLDDVDYAAVTPRAVTLTARLVKPPVANPAIEDNTPKRKLLRLQVNTKIFRRRSTFKRLSPT